MPIDTAKKRRSSVAGTLPTADGAIDAGDRQASTGLYDPTTGGGGGGGGGGSGSSRRASLVPGVLPDPTGTIDATERRLATGVYDREADSGTADTSAAVMFLWNVRNRVDVKITKDRGSGTSSASVAVTVPFNKNFADIILLDAFPISNTGQKIFRVIDFVDAPDPASFDVRFYDNSGTQLAVDFGWEATGVLRSS